MRDIELEIRADSFAQLLQDIEIRIDPHLSIRQAGEISQQVEDAVFTACQEPGVQASGTCLLLWSRAPRGQMIGGNRAQRMGLVTSRAPGRRGDRISGTGR
jgi:hypothetical protein